MRTLPTTARAASHDRAHTILRVLSMQSILIEIPADALPSPADPPEAFVKEARFLLALKLFELGRLSSGKAGRLCGMGRVEFLLAAGRAGVALVSLDEEETAKELTWP